MLRSVLLISQPIIQTYGTKSDSRLRTVKLSSWSASILALTSLPDADVKTLTVQLERTACYGNCPAYSVTIHGDGRVEYNGKTHVKEKGLREGRVEADQIKSLLNEFATAKFFTLSEDYSGENCTRYCTDILTAVTEIDVREASHHVKH